MTKTAARKAEAAARLDRLAVESAAVSTALDAFLAMPRATVTDEVSTAWNACIDALRALNAERETLLAGPRLTGAHADLVAANID